MELSLWVTFLLLISSLNTLHGRLPDFTPAPPRLQAKVSPDSDAIDTDGRKMVFSRLPGLCGRLKRRRVTILCNLEKFCWPGRSRGRGQSAQSGQVCRCPRGSRCFRFFVHSL